MRVEVSGERVPEDGDGVKVESDDPGKPERAANLSLSVKFKSCFLAVVAAVG